MQMNFINWVFDGSFKWWLLGAVIVYIIARFS